MKNPSRPTLSTSKALIPNILSIAGSDPSGGAGIQADIKTITQCGGYAMAVITSLTAQNTCAVSAISYVSPAMIRAQISALQEDIRIDAIKIGMLGNAENIQAVIDALSDRELKIVVDPVMVAKGGARLLEDSAIDLLREALLPKADILTPNLPEAAVLLSQPEAKNTHQIEQQAEQLLAMGSAAVIIKGGHLPGAESADFLITHHIRRWYPAEKRSTRNTHGTGCTFSSALATYLGRGLSCEDATVKAKHYVTQAIRYADCLEVGKGHGPTYHAFTNSDLVGG